MPTEHLVPDLVFLYEISEQFLVHTSLINDLRSYLASRTISQRRVVAAYSSVPERASKLNGFK